MHASVYLCKCLHRYGEKCVGSHACANIGYMMLVKGKCMKQEKIRIKTD